MNNLPYLVVWLPRATSMILSNSIEKCQEEVMYKSRSTMTTLHGAQILPTSLPTSNMTFLLEKLIRIFSGWI
jgi:hypothetical protein